MDKQFRQHKGRRPKIKNEPNRCLEALPGAGEGFDPSQNTKSRGISMINGTSKLPDSFRIQYFAVLFGVQAQFRKSTGIGSTFASNSNGKNKSTENFDFLVGEILVSASENKTFISTVTDNSGFSVSGYRKLC